MGGKDEGNVCDCVDKLRAMEEDYITELIDRGAYSARKEEPKREVVNAFRTPFINNRDWYLIKRDCYLGNIYPIFYT